MTPTPSLDPAAPASTPASASGSGSTEGRDVLMRFAGESGAHGLIEELLNEGVNPNFLHPDGPQGQSPLAAALLGGHLQNALALCKNSSAPLLLDAHPDTNPFRLLAFGLAPHPSVSMAQARRLADALAHRGADINRSDHTGLTPLGGCYAAWRHTASSRQRAAGLLIQLGADPNALDPLGRSPLFHAAQAQDQAGCAALIASGADDSIVDRQGHTPLICAFKAPPSHFLACAVFLAQGASPAALAHRDPMGRSALFHACQEASITLPQASATPIINALRALEARGLSYQEPDLNGSRPVDELLKTAHPALRAFAETIALQAAASPPSPASHRSGSARI